MTRTLAAALLLWGGTVTFAGRIVVSTAPEWAGLEVLSDLSATPTVDQPSPEEVQPD